MPPRTQRKAAILLRLLPWVGLAGALVVIILWQFIAIPRWVVGIATLFFIFSIFLRAQTNDRYLTAVSSSTKDPFHGYEDRTFKLLQDSYEFAGSYSEMAIDSLIRMALVPARYRRRIDESLDLDSSYTRRLVEMTLKPPSSAAHAKRNQRVLVPLIQARKGRLFHGFSIRSPGDPSIATLSYYDSLTATVCATLSLFCAAYNVPPDPSEWTAKQASGIRELIEVVTSTPDAGKDPEEWMNDKICEASKRFQLLGLVPAGDDDEAQAAQDTLFKFLSLSTAWYLIVVEMAPAPTMRIEYEYIRRTSELQDGGSGWRAAIRSFMGYPSALISVPLLRAARSSSYHLSIQAPPNSFIGPSVIVDSENRQVLAPSSPSTLMKWYVRRPKTGTNFAHLYTRDLGEIGTKCKFELRVPERPYCSQLLATSATALVAGIALLFHSLTLESEPPSFDVIAAALGALALLVALVPATISMTRRALSPSLFAVVNLGLIVIALIGTIVAYAVRPPEAFWVAGKVLLTSALIVSLFTLGIRLIEYQQLNHGRLGKAAIQ